MDRLRVFLEGFQYDDRMAAHRVEYLHAWHDNELTVGNPWDGEIKNELQEMDIFVPLVSPQFFQSWYIQNVELPYAKDRHVSDQILVVPILLYDINLRQKCAFLHSFNTLPSASEWWSKYPDVNDAYRAIDDGLWKAIEGTLKNKAAKAH